MSLSETRKYWFRNNDGNKLTHAGEATNQARHVSTIASRRKNDVAKEVALFSTQATLPAASLMCFTNAIFTSAMFLNIRHPADHIATIAVSIQVSYTTPAHVLSHPCSHHLSCRALQQPADPSSEPWHPDVRQPTHPATPPSRHEPTLP